AARKLASTRSLSTSIACASVSMTASALRLRVARSSFPPDCAVPETGWIKAFISMGLSREIAVSMGSVAILLFGIRFRDGGPYCTLSALARAAGHVVLPEQRPNYGFRWTPAQSRL